MIWPKLLALLVDTGLDRFTLLSRLNTSRRNCTFRSFALGHGENCLISEAFTVIEPGPVSGLRGELPNVPVAGAAKAAVLKYFAMTSARARDPEITGSPTRSGR